MMEARARRARRASARAEARSSARSTASSGTPAGPTSSRRCSAPRTRSPGRTSTSRCPEPTGVVARRSRPTSRALDGLVSRLAPALVGGNAAVVVASETHPLAAIELAEALATSDVPGGVVNLLTGFRAELAPMPRRAHGRERDRRHRRRRHDRPSSSGSPPRTSSASSAAPADEQSPWEISRVPRAEDRLAPDRALVTSWL